MTAPRLADAPVADTIEGVRVLSAPRRTGDGYYSIPPSGRSPVRVRYEVLIDADGRPDMRTFRALGPGAAENRDAIARWVEQSHWAPAVRGGRPVAEVYKGSLEVQIRRR